MRCLAAWAVAGLQACTLVTSQYCGCGHASVRVTSPRVTGEEGGWSSVPGPHRYCHPAVSTTEKSSSPATREILFAGCWLVAAGCRRRAESRKFKASVRAGLDGVAGRAGAAVPRQAAGSCTANRVRRPRTRSRAERSPVSRSEPGHGCGHGHWRCRGSVLHC